MNVLTPVTVRPFVFQIIVDHRTFQPMSEEPFYDLLGFDSGGLKIGLGLRFGIVESLDIGMYRLSNGVLPYDVYELDLRWRALRQDDHSVNLGLRAGGSMFTQKGADPAGGGYAQLVLDHLFVGRVRLGTGLFFHSDSTDDSKFAEDTDWSLAVPAYLDIRILDWLAWNVEITATVAGFGARWPNFSSAVKFITSRHTFSLVLSNNQYVNADGIVANSDRGFEDLIIGFTITRDLSFD